MINYKAIKRTIKNMFNRKNCTCFYDNHIIIKICINGILYKALVSKKQYKEYIKHLNVKHRPTKLDITYTNGYLNIYNRTATYPSKRRKKYYSYERSY